MLTVEKTPQFEKIQKQFNSVYFESSLLIAFLRFARQHMSMSTHITIKISPTIIGVIIATITQLGQKSWLQSSWPLLEMYPATFTAIMYQHTKIIVKMLRMMNTARFLHFLEQKDMILITSCIKHTNSDLPKDADCRMLSWFYMIWDVTKMQVMAKNMAASVSIDIYITRRRSFVACQPSFIFSFLTIKFV